MFISLNVRKTNAVAIAKKEYNKKSVCFFFPSQNLKVEITSVPFDFFRSPHNLLCHGNPKDPPHPTMQQKRSAN